MITHDISLMMFILLLSYYSRVTSGQFCEYVLYMYNNVFIVLYTLCAILECLNYSIHILGQMFIVGNYEDILILWFNKYQQNI